MAKPQRALDGLRASRAPAPPQLSRHGLERWKDPYTPRGDRLYARTTAGIEQLLEARDLERVTEIALVELEDERELVELLMS